MSAAGHSPVRVLNGMKTWRLVSSSHPTSSFDNYSGIRLQECKVPTISAPNEVLIQVRATSVNPLDIRMMSGYGRNLLDFLNLFTDFSVKASSDRYPLTLGRDFSGQIVSVGNSVSIRFKPGDHVYGVVEPQKQGAHAEFLTTPQYCINHKPKNLTHNEAASIPFAGLTAWSAIHTIGHVTPDNAFSKNSLVLGASGGVGSFAAQLLKCWGSNVVATASHKNLNWLKESIGVDQAIDYNDHSELAKLHGSFDFVLDASRYSKNMAHEQIVAKSSIYTRPNGVYVTLSPPILDNTDKLGLALGTTKTLVDAARDFISSSAISLPDQLQARIARANVSGQVRWGLFMPDQMALSSITRLVEMGKLKPHIKTTTKFLDIHRAYEAASNDSPINSGGKVVVDVHEGDKKDV